MYTVQKSNYSIYWTKTYIKLLYSQTKVDQRVFVSSSKHGFIMCNERIIFEQLQRICVHHTILGGWKLPATRRDIEINNIMPHCRGGRAWAEYLCLEGLEAYTAWTLNRILWNWLFGICSFFCELVGLLNGIFPFLGIQLDITPICFVFFCLIIVSVCRCQIKLHFTTSRCISMVLTLI